MLKRIKHISYHEVLCVLSLLLILAFQAYWLHENYDLKKAQFFKQVETEAQSYLQLIQMQKLTGTVKINSSGKTGQFSMRLSDSVNKKSIKDLIKANKDTVDASAISIDIPNLDELANTKGDDSLIYQHLKNNIDVLQSGAFAVHEYNAKAKETVYPRQAKVCQQNNSLTITTPWNLELRFAICFDNLPKIVFIKMSGVFALSLLYIALSITVVILLFNTTWQKKRLLESKNVFTQNITHELKIPISVLYLISEKLNAIDKAEMPPAAGKYIVQYRTALDRLSALVDKILNTARVQQSKITLNKTHVSISYIISAAISQIQLLITESSATIDYNNIPENLIINADASQMESVFINLIENSIKYNDHTALITLTAKTSGNDCYIYIKDNGKGIPKAYFNEVFQPYFRVPEQDLHTIKGYGLGLSYVKQIIRLHNGDVKIAESSAEGTTIEIRIPSYAD